MNLCLFGLLNTAVDADAAAVDNDVVTPTSGGGGMRVFTWQPWPGWPCEFSAVRM